MHESCHTYEWVTSHIWMSHVTRLWWIRVDSVEHVFQMCLRHVTHMKETCHTQESIASRIWTRMNTSRHVYEKGIHKSRSVMSRVWMSHVTHMDGSCHMCACTFTYMHLCIKWGVIVTYVHAHMIHAHKWHSESHMCMRIWLMHICDIASHICACAYDASPYVT